MVNEDMEMDLTVSIVSCIFLREPSLVNEMKHLKRK